MALLVQTGGDDNTNSAAQIADSCQFPVLVAHMIHRSDSKITSHWTFREVLDKLISITSIPVRQMLSQVSRFTSLSV